MGPLKTKKRSHSVEVDLDDKEVSNKDLLIAISTLIDRMSAMENSWAKMVDEKVATLEKNVMEQIDTHKQSANERFLYVDKQIQDIEHRISVEMKVAMDEQRKLIEDTINEKIATKQSVASRRIESINSKGRFG